MSTLVLSPDQQKAWDAFAAFVCDPQEPVFILKGYAGTGKSTLVRELLRRLPALLKTTQLLDPDGRPWELELTATTNQAADTLAQIVQQPVRTIHSLLELRVQQNYETQQTKLVPRSQGIVQEHKLILIDEASYIDAELLRYVFSRTRNCKIVFVGDPAQLKPVKYSRTPAFDLQAPTAELTQVMRQAEGSPVLDLATQFRRTVQEGEFFQFIPDGVHVQHLDDAGFQQAVNQEFTRPDWAYTDSKILAWTNRQVIAYNHYVRDLAQGQAQLQVGDFAVNNRYVQLKTGGIKTDAMVRITAIEDECEHGGVRGHWFRLDHVHRAFMPLDLKDRDRVIKHALEEGNYALVQEATDQWIDLRAAYACTVNKSQGSTYDKVFIDLDDISRCRNPDTLARMLYVAVSRARHQVIFRGDLV